MTTQRWASQVAAAMGLALLLAMPASILSAQIEQPQENTKIRDSRYYVYVKGIT